MTYYILDGHNPVPCNDLMEWGKWMGIANRIVSQEKVNGAKVSTIFLGIDHSFGGPNAAPKLFETMIFGGPYDGYQRRCMFWNEAEAMHKGAVEMVKRAMEITKR